MYIKVLSLLVSKRNIPSHLQPFIVPHPTKLPANFATSDRFTVGISGLELNAAFDPGLPHDDNTTIIAAIT
jgi:hypothetical protein